MPREAPGSYFSGAVRSVSGLFYHKLINSTCLLMAVRSISHWGAARHAYGERSERGTVSSGCSHCQEKWESLIGQLSAGSVVWFSCIECRFKSSTTLLGLEVSRWLRLGFRSKELFTPCHQFQYRSGEDELGGLGLGRGIWNLLPQVTRPKTGPAC